MRNTSFEAFTHSSREDDNYVAQLWRDLQPTCEYYVNLFAKTETMKEELYLEYAVVFIENLNKYDPGKDANMKTYFSRVFYSRGLDFLRKAKRIPPLLKEEELYAIEQYVDPEQNVEQQMVLKDEIHKLYRALEKLEPEEKQFIQKIFFEENSVAHLTQTYQGSYAKMDSKKRRILKKIKKIFDEI